MRLRIQNIGKISAADIEINGITIVAGENNTGKSTVGKTLYAIFNSFCRTQKRIFAERVRSVSRYIGQMYMENNERGLRMLDAEAVANEIVHHADQFQNVDGLERGVKEELQKYGEGETSLPKEELLHEYVIRILEVLRVSDDEFLKLLLEHRFDAEFNGQICSIYGKQTAEAVLNIKDENIAVIWEENRVSSIQNQDAVSLNTEVIYIDDPFVLDDVRSSYYRMSWSMRDKDHRSDLCQKLYQSAGHQTLVDEIVVKDKLEHIYQKLAKIVDGEVSRGSGNRIVYQKKGSDKALDVRNLSTGLKTFVILKMLLTNGAIEQNGTIVLDEPEIHLHPEWQLIFAEIIVLIHKEFGVHILINTHSPYFLNAIEVYTEKYEVAKRCKYYLSELQENGMACIKDVTNDTEQIYRKLAQPLQDLEDERACLE